MQVEPISEEDGCYHLLPLRFSLLDEARYLLTNLVGEHYVTRREIVESLIVGRLPRQSPEFAELESRHFLFEGRSTAALDLLAAKWRTKLSHFPDLTNLFIFVTTLRCDHACRYCQASRQGPAAHEYDMAPETARRAVQVMLQTPSPAIKVEFQGGESLLNFDTVRVIVEETEQQNQGKKELSFVLTTNLGTLTDEHLSFMAAHRISVSTSLDGPTDLHNFNRPCRTYDSYGATRRGIDRARAVLGHDAVSALMTATAESLDMPREIVNEYRAAGFRSIFLRSLNPYGLAVRSGLAAQYSMDDWLAFYLTALDYIIDLNETGETFVEEFAAVLLRKILTPFPVGFVDLQSPAGAGLLCLVFNYDGRVFPSDEARMLAEMGDARFCLGHVATGSLRGLLSSGDYCDILAASMAECVPMCSDCALVPYCGADPVRHYALEGDMVGFKPRSSFCRKHSAVLGHLIRLLEDSPRARRVLESWV